MRKILLLSAFLIQLGVSAQNLDTINISDQNGLKQGYWKKESPDGKLLYEGSFLNNKPIGEFKRYDKDGKIKTQLFYHPNGKTETVFFDKQGKIITKGAFLNTVKDGEWKYFANSRLVLSEFYANGFKNGAKRIYDEDEKIISEIFFINDTIDGVAKEFYNNGNIKWESNYVKGVKNGRSASYYSDEIIESEGKYLNNIKDGFWSFYNEKGILRYTIVYKDGVIQNSNQIDSVTRQEFQKFEENRYKIKDPQNYINNPEDFFKK